MPAKKASGYSLCFIVGQFTGGELPLMLGDQVIIGRDPSSELPLQEEGVSRQHAKLLVSSTAVELRDLNSTNGTFVNGQKVSQHMLRPGDKILIGRSIMMLVPDPVANAM